MLAVGTTAGHVAEMLAAASTAAEARAAALWVGLMAAVWVEAAGAALTAEVPEEAGAEMAALLAVAHGGAEAKMAALRAAWRAGSWAEAARAALLAAALVVATAAGVALLALG